ncbi:MAG: glycosyltransferase, partial [Proteobacteria bacterium]|nr:glycosyltransferase [Pseudomonadota bacterium]
EIKERNLSNNIISLGFLDNKEKYRVISNSKMLLFPSRFESFGIVVAESLNFGIPVIAFDLEALKLNFDEGILFSKNKEEFIKNIFTILEYPSIAEKIGNSGKSFVKKYSWEKIVKNFVDNLV